MNELNELNERQSQMRLLLRGHHVLCLLGYRGKGYSESFCTNMTDIYDRLRMVPDTRVEIVEGPDEICKAFPTDQEVHCENESVAQQDQKILDQLGIHHGEVYKWSDLCERTAKLVQPTDIAKLCAGCQWEPYGMCVEGIEHIRQQTTLRVLPNK